MRYIVIDDLNGCLFPLINEDTGCMIVFNNEEEALIEAKNCQDGIVLKID